MIIGIDARSLSHQPLTGIGRYTLEMSRALSKLPRVSLYLYSPAPISRDLATGLNSTVIRTGQSKNRILKQIWSEAYLPFFIKKDGVDVFWGPAHRLPRLLPKSMPRVVTIHDLVWKYAKETMRRTTYILEKYSMPSALRAADAIVADSKATADAVALEFRVTADRLVVIPLAANWTKNTVPFDALKTYGIDRPYFLFVGTLEPRKNLSRLLKAYALLSPAKKKHAMLVIVGGKGWGDVNINKSINELGLAGNTRVLGYVDDQVLTALYTHAQFLTMPSLYEGFGLPILEAMVHGTPVLTANNSSMPEVAGDAGLLVDALDIKSIAKGLEQLISDDQMLTHLAANAKKNAARYGWEESARQLVTVFERAVANRHPR